MKFVIYVTSRLMNFVTNCTGGLDESRLSPVDYRTEMREAKARVDLPWNRVNLDEFGYSVDLLLHALESQLKVAGVS